MNTKCIIYAFLLTGCVATQHQSLAQEKPRHVLSDNPTETWGEVEKVHQALRPPDDWRAHEPNPEQVAEFQKQVRQTAVSFAEKAREFIERFPTALGITMRIGIPSFVFAFVFLVAGCGVGFAPGYSMHDKNYFADPPHIAVNTNTATYALRWQYGTMGFFFQPRSKIVGGQLCFSLQGTSSSGSLSGRYSEIPITDPKMIQALRSGGAFWLEPGGTKVSLALTNL